MSGPDKEACFVTLARIVRPQGNRGEVAAELDSDDAGIFRLVRDVYLSIGAEGREMAHIESARPHKGRVVLKFDGVDTIDQAEKLVGRLVQIPAAARPAPPAGRYYLADLIGCDVVDSRTGRRLGKVEEIQETGGTPLLRAWNGERELLVPFAASICVEINPAQKTIRVELPEGLEDLNKV